MNKEKKHRSDADLRQDLVELVDDINADMIKQPANRKRGDFNETKQVFLSRGRLEKEHLKWYDKRRHTHMKLTLLEHFNALNEGKELTSIDTLKNIDKREKRQYPSMDWIQIACHAAVAGIDELRREEEQTRNQRSPVHDPENQTNQRAPELMPNGKILNFEEVAKTIAQVTGNTMATARENLRRQCSRRLKQLNTEELESPQLLYKNKSELPDLYIIPPKQSTGTLLFQRMKFK